MYTENDKNKMRDFIQKLISNPSLNNEPELVVEENIILFFITNTPALKPTFSSSNYFPDLSWNDVQNLFLEILFEEINKDLLPSIENIFRKKINFQFMNTLLNRQLPSETFQKEMINFTTKTLKRFEIRRNIDAVIKIINNNLIDKYLNQIFEKKSYIAREILIVERSKIPPDMTSHLIKVIMLISLLGYIRADMNDATLQQKIAAKEIKLGNLYMQKSYYEKLIRQFTTGLSILSEDLVKKCISFHLNFNDDRSVPATSRFAKILFTLGKNYKPHIKIDKGADTYEKSWFQAQKKNYKYFGFDIDMVNELYRISAENYW